MAWPAVASAFRAFRLPRQGYALEECQDALAGDAERGRFAIADGAAESPYSALWAQLLVEEFVRQNERWPNWANWLPTLQERWSAAICQPASALRPPLVSSAENGWRLAEGGVPWYLEPGLYQGAFATFLGVVIEEQNWFAVAVGDSCLFQVRQDELISTFPVFRAADFSNAPWLVGSRTSPSEVPYKNGLQQLGVCQPRDRLWLMTDALAQWFLIQAESGAKPWLALESLLHASADENAAQQAFAAWIEALRATRQLRNDDVALLAISL
jgi:hypothetical protein